MYSFREKIQSSVLIGKQDKDSLVLHTSFVNEVRQVLFSGKYFLWGKSVSLYTKNIVPYIVPAKIFPPAKCRKHIVHF